MAKLTKKTVEAQPVGATECMLWDRGLPGFGVRILPSGRRSHLVQYRVGRRSRRVTLGPHGVLTTEQARGMASQVLADVRAAKDPALERKQRREAITVGELADRFDKEHIAVQRSRIAASRAGVGRDESGAGGAAFSDCRSAAATADWLSAQRDHEASMEECRRRQCRSATPRLEDWSEDRAVGPSGRGGFPQHRAQPVQPARDRRHPARKAALRPAAVLAALAGSGWTEGCANS